MVEHLIGDNCGQAKKYVDETTGERIAKLLPGFFYITNENEHIMTILGSCVATCIRDPKSKVGGMNHFMLPKAGEGYEGAWSDGESALNRFGNYAMPNLINSLIKNGAVKTRLEVKIFGGGQLLDMSTNVGEQNIDFVTTYLQSNELEVVASDLGSNHARKLIYDPITGVTRLKRLRDVYTGYVVSKENALLKDLSALESPTPGGERK